MTIREAGKEVIKDRYGLRTYRIGFINKHGEEDETELDAHNMKELSELWSSLCPEFECAANSVRYIERAS